MSDTEKLIIKQLSVETSLPIFWTDLSHLTEQLTLARQAIDELRETNPETVESNVKSVYMSPWKSHRINDKLLPISEIVIDYTKQAVVQHMNNDFHYFYGRQQPDFIACIFK